MTLAEIIQSDALMLTPADVAPVLGVDPQKIRVQAIQDLLSEFGSDGRYHGEETKQ